MTTEIRHGPVTMHRAIERTLMKEINRRPADTPRSRPSGNDGDVQGGDRAEGPRAALRDATTARGGRTGKHDKGESAGGRRDARS